MNSALPWQLGRILIVAGLLLVVVGLLFIAAAKWGFGGLGRLPGDIVYRRKNFQFYFPVVTCIVLSLALTLFFWIVSVLTRK